MELITARIFDNPIDAHLLKTKLESEGITCYLYDEHTVTIDPMVNIAVGGIKLKIEKFDIEKVKKILQEIEGRPYVKENNETLKCPNCNSIQLYSGIKSMKGFSGIISIIISFLLLVYPLHYKLVYKCKECGTEFKKP